MTRVAFLDPIGGLAGDMLVAALLDAGAPREVLDATVAGLGLDDVAVEVVQARASATRATRVLVHAPRRAEPRGASSVLRRIAGADLPERVATLSSTAVSRLADAEAAVHGVAPADVTLHELGADDTLVDVCGAFALLHALEIDRLSCGPLPMGRGLVPSDHGTLPVPAPATLELLTGVPIIGIDTPGELVTPTGAAIVTSAAATFGPIPPMTLQAVGTGAGTRTLPDRPNVVRLMLGTAPDRAQGEVAVLEANVDDLVPELVPDVLDACLAAGALDVWTTPIQMKKGRPGILLGVLAEPENEGVVASAILRHSSTLGVRVRRSPRYELDRAIREVMVSGHPIRVKIGMLTGQVVNVAPEHDDCATVAAATSRPTKQIWAEALAAATAQIPGYHPVER